VALEAVQEFMRNAPRGIIAIDGELGAGKSTLSNKLSNIYKVPVIHVDDYLIKGQNQYLEAVKSNELKKAIQNAPLPVIIEGACLLTILSRIEVQPALHFFLYRGRGSDYKKNSSVVKEVENYIYESRAPFRADKAIYMNNSQTNQLDVDIAYIKSKMVVSVFLALGGVVALLVGAYVLTSGVSSNDSAVFEILGAKVTTEGIGAVILGSSVLWAYFSYLAKPKYSRRREIKSSTAPDGSHSSYEFESATMTATDRKSDD
jgi:hypothetical protein